MASSISSLGAMSSGYIPPVSGRQQRGTDGLLEKIDANGDGLISTDEFISSRPADVTEDQAQQLWHKLDASNNGSITRSQFVTAMQNEGPQPGPPAGGGSDIVSTSDSLASSTDSASAVDELMKALLTAIKQYSSAIGQNEEAASDQKKPSLNDLFNKIDMNGDGTISAEEFVSNRPDGVSEEQANQMWRQLDTENTGSLTESQFSSAMEKLGPPPGPPPISGNTPKQDGVSETTGASAFSDAAGNASAELVNDLLAAIKRYAATMAQNGNSSANSLTSSGLLSTVV